MRAEVETQNSLEAALDRLKDLVEGSRVSEARAFVGMLEARWPDSPRVQHWARVLAPPRVIPGPDIKGRSLRREHDWLRDHANEYPGQWVSVYEDRLVASGPDLQEVVARTREAIGQKSALLSLVPERSE